jgi:hypothetical protein
MKKTLSLLLVFGVALSVVISMPTDGGVDSPRVMYNSVLHSEGSPKVAKIKVVAKAPEINPIEELEAVEEEAIVEEEVKETKSDPTAEEDICGFPDRGGADLEYTAQLITVRKQFRHDEDELFRVKVFLKNTGNAPWFSPDSKCPGAHVYLGTAREEDHVSYFLNPEIKVSDVPDFPDVDEFVNSAVSKTRVRLDEGQMRIEPGEIAAYTFWAYADNEASVYREYFMPVIDNVRWMDEAEFKLDVYTGETNESATELRKKLFYAYNSSKVDDLKIDGVRSVEVDLSEQKLWLKLDDHVIREFVVSTGKSSTPTPVGTFPIFLKNEVRVGHAAPHYIMPRFQMFTYQGAGLHALPSLSTDGGVFWTEALDHIGQPMSHGCVRMLPDDADFTFDFTEIGDEIEIHY